MTEIMGLRIVEETIPLSFRERDYMSRPYAKALRIYDGEELIAVEHTETFNRLAPQIRAVEAQEIGEKDATHS